MKINLNILKQNNTIRGNCTPRFWRFVYNEENVIDCLEIIDNMGYAMEPESVETIIKGLQNYLEVFSNEDIKKYNKKKEKQIYKKLKNNSQQKSKQNNIEDNYGIVYILKSKEDNIYKIGATTNLSKRIEQISPKLPFKIEVILKIKTNYIFKLENELHQKFKNKQLNGEWFKLNKQDIKYIKLLKGDNDE